MFDVYNYIIGHVSVFLDVTKGSELHYILYNPITCVNDEYTDEKLKEFARCVLYNFACAFVISITVESLITKLLFNENLLVMKKI